MNKMSRYRYSFLPVVVYASALLTLTACSQGPQFREEIVPAGNEYIDPPDPSRDDSDQILADYSQFPDSVRAVIEQLLPGGEEVLINHWGPFRYTVTKSYADGHAHKIFIYLTGNVSKILYIKGDYQERPGLFFITGTERPIPLDSLPTPVLNNAERHTGGARQLGAWTATSDIGLTFVIEVVGFQDDDTTSFAYRPDGVLKTMSEARRMRKGVARKWTQAEIEELLGKYHDKYSVDTVLGRIHSVPYDHEQGFQFIVLGDNRINQPVWEAVCKSISKKNALFAIVTGDLVREGEPEQFDEYLFGVMEKYGNFNLVPVVGNHDISYDGMAFAYLTSFGSNALNYYFDYGESRFVILDNCSRVTDFLSQLEAADRWLAETPEDFRKFVFIHVPPGEIKKWSYHSMSGEKSRQFTDLMTSHQVDHVFAGHIHAYSTAHHEGVDYTVTGGAGADLHEQYGPAGSVHHYVIVNVTPEGVHQQVVRLHPE
ncbi:MAG: metallophosphoesterase [Fidelibacterota bacterium]|nr:MAG: metallophosphoesterase [Candidatus Neomarinimicrobiota bacterium]